MFIELNQTAFLNQHSVLNPQVPFNNEIPNGLQPGKKIVIKAKIQPNCQYFCVNFLTNNNNIAFHINPRFVEKQVVRNTYQDFLWGAEERYSGFPFKLDEPFEMVISTELDHFKVYVNSQHLFDYRHRISIREISKLDIKGQIVCYSIKYVGGSPRSHEVHNPPVPSTVPIHDGLNPGKLIQINGVVPHHAKRFEINIQTGDDNQPDNIGLHFNPRWNDPYSQEPITIRNNLQNNEWGQEDRQNQPPFPFQKGAPFELFIFCEPNEFKITVNDHHYISFSHRTPFHLNNNIGFGGDVVINSVKEFN